MKLATYNISNRGLYLYYGLLLLVMSAMINPLSSPPQLLRLAIIIALVFPLFAYKNNWTPAIISLFFIISNNSFTSTILPSGVYIYYTLLIVLAIQVKRSNCLDKRPVAFFLFLYTFFVNLITESTIAMSSLYLSLYFLFMFSFFVRKDDTLYPHFFSYVFILSSLVLSLLLIIYGKQFAMDRSGDFETYTWKDPNYFCGAIAMGVVASLFELFSIKDKKQSKKFFLLIVILVDLFVILLSASRGAVLDIAIVLVLLISFSTTSKRVKIWVILLICIAIFLMYRFGILEFLIYRLTEEETMDTGSGRIDVWSAKLSLFFQGTPLQRLFGYGCSGGRALAGNYGRYFGLLSTHNDFLSFLIYYGYIGFVSFLVLLFRPLKRANNKSLVISGTAFLVTSCFTIEPFAGGNIAWYAFLFYIYLWSQIPESTQRYVQAKTSTKIISK